MSREFVARAGRVVVLIFAVSAIGVAVNRIILTISGNPGAAGQFGSNYIGQSVPVLLHVVPGILFMALGPLQFVAGLRRRHPDLHRWLGRIYLVAATVLGLTALYLGVRVPFGGFAEAAATVVFAGVFLFSLARAYLYILHRRVQQHREWMIRGFAVGLGIVTIRLVTVPLIVAAQGQFTGGMLGLAFWVGFTGTLLVGEWWVRATRPRRLPRATAGREASAG